MPGGRTLQKAFQNDQLYWQPEEESEVPVLKISISERKELTASVCMGCVANTRLAVRLGCRARPKPRHDQKKSMLAAP